MLVDRRALAAALASRFLPTPEWSGNAAFRVGRDIFGTVMGDVLRGTVYVALWRDDDPTGDEPVRDLGEFAAGDVAGMADAICAELGGEVGR